MSEIRPSTRVAAIQQFRRARRNARINKLLSVLQGKQDDLLLFDEVRQTLDLAHPHTEKLKDIQLESAPQQRCSDLRSRRCDPQSGMDGVNGGYRA